jgi:2-keto-3-deoxy-L-arabinonate dehydratase
VTAASQIGNEPGDRPVSGGMYAGVYPMLYAFFDDAGRIDPGAMRRQVESCVEVGTQGVAVLGLATETHKLDLFERREILDIAARSIGGRLPLAVTVAEPSVAGQIAFAKRAADVGAAWLILQPPNVAGVGEGEVEAFISKVADGIELPFAIQNAPGLLPVSLSAETMNRIANRHANFRLVKAETPAVGIGSFVEATSARFRVFAGYAGVDWLDAFAAGAAGLIPATDLMDVHTKVWKLLTRNSQDSRVAAVEMHNANVALMQFTMQSLEHLLCYAKRLAAMRLGISFGSARSPAVHPSALGMDILTRLSRHLPGLP